MDYLIPFLQFMDVIEQPALAVVSCISGLMLGMIYMANHPNSRWHTLFVDKK